MHFSAESLLVILLIGAIAGWLAGQIIQGTGFGLLGDIVIGIVGAFIASWLFPRLGFHLGSGIAAQIIAATIGAVLLLVIMRLFRRRGRW
jgi:uncharacterized membrane protein YeaQ/YmgE (transglycosylase-associated protein family)